MSLASWPASERPRERLLRAGPAGLSDGELLAVLLGSGPKGSSALGLAHSLLRYGGSLVGALAASPAELQAISGLGPARLARLQAAVEIGRRYLANQAPRGAALQAPADAARFFHARLADLPHEVFGCLFLDTRHRLIRYEELIRGTIDGATVHPREVVKRALHHNAAAMIVAQPPVRRRRAQRVRPRDYAQARAGTRARRNRLLDHLVVSRDGHVSLAERGWI